MGKSVRIDREISLNTKYNLTVESMALFTAKCQQKQNNHTFPPHFKRCCSLSLNHLCVWSQPQVELLHCIEAQHHQTGFKLPLLVRARGCKPLGFNLKLTCWPKFTKSDEKLFISSVPDVKNGRILFSLTFDLRPVSVGLCVVQVRQLQVTDYRDCRDFRDCRACRDCRHGWLKIWKKVNHSLT